MTRFGTLITIKTVDFCDHFILGDERTNGRNQRWPGKCDTFFEETGGVWAHFGHILELSAGRVFARSKSMCQAAVWASGAVRKSGHIESPPALRLVLFLGSLLLIYYHI